MRATIVHESRGRMRLRLRQKNMTLRQADLLETWLKGQPWTKEVVVHERTGCVIVTYTGDCAAVLSAIGGFTWAGAEETVTLPGHSTRALNREFQEKLVGKVLMKGAATLFLPAPCGRPCALAYDSLPPQGASVPGTAENQSGTIGCPVHRHLCGPPRLRHSWYGDVPAGDWGTAGGLDAKEVRGRPWRRACPSMWTGFG